MDEQLDLKKLLRMSIAESISRVHRVPARIPNEALDDSRDSRREGHPEQGLEILSRQANVENDGDALMIRGLCHMNLDLDERALQDFIDAALYFDERKYRALINVSCVLNKLKRYEAAEQVATHAAQGFPGDLLAWINKLSAICLSKQTDRLPAVVAQMKTACPSWHNDEALRQHLDEDVQLRELRTHPDFDAMFAEIYARRES